MVSGIPEAQEYFWVDKVGGLAIRSAVSSDSALCESAAHCPQLPVDLIIAIPRFLEGVDTKRARVD